MTGPTDRLVVTIVVLTAAALLARVLAARTRRRAAAAVGATPGPSAAVIAFHAHWCGACAAQRHQLDTLHDIEVRYVDVEQHQAAARQHGVRSLPTTIVVADGGTVTAVNHGLVAAEVLRRQVAQGRRVSTAAATRPRVTPAGPVGPGRRLVTTTRRRGAGARPGPG